MDNQSFRSFAFNLAIEGDNPKPFIEYRVMNKNKTNTYMIVYIYVYIYHKHVNPPLFCPSQVAHFDCKECILKNHPIPHKRFYM